MGIFDAGADLLFGESDAAGQANKYLDQIPEAMRKYLDPSFQRGERAGGALEEQYGSMTSDPQDFINKIMQGYQQSDAYKYQQGEMGQQAANTAAAGGMLGSAFDQKQQQAITQGLLGQDQQQWLKNVLGVQGQGLAGEQNLYGYGQQAGANLAESEANVLGTKGQLGFQQERERGRRGQDLFSGLMQGVGAYAGAGGFGKPRTT